LATRPKNSQDAAEWQVDLIVAGVRRAKPAAAHLEEGTAYQLVRQAPCAVLTVCRRSLLADVGPAQASNTQHPNTTRSSDSMTFK